MRPENFNQEAFNKAMNDLFNVMNEHYTIQESIAGNVFDFDRWDNEDQIVPCIYSEGGMHAVLYTLCDYDIVHIEDDGRIDVEGSNFKDAARLIAPYISTKNGKSIAHEFYSIIY